MNDSEMIDDLRKAIQENGEDREMDRWSINYIRSHKRRYLHELNLIDSLKITGGKILEIGSAPFHMTIFLAKKGYDVTGWDISPERFQSLIQTHGLIIEKVNIETDDVKSWESMFDFVVFNEVFEHLRINPIETLNKINSVLKPGGGLLLSTPNLSSLGNRISILIGKGFDSPFDEFNKLNKYGHMGHVREYTARQVSVFLENTHFHVEKVLYPNYQRFTLRFAKSTLFKLGYILYPKGRPYFQIIARKS